MEWWSALLACVMEAFSTLSGFSYRGDHPVWHGGPLCSGSCVVEASSTHSGFYIEESILYGLVVCMEW